MRYALLVLALVLLPVATALQEIPEPVWNGTSVDFYSTYLDLHVKQAVGYQTFPTDPVQQEFRIATHDLSQEADVYIAYVFNQELQSGTVTRNGNNLNSFFTHDEYAGKHIYHTTNTITLQPDSSRAWNLSYVPAVGDLTRKWDLYFYMGPNSTCYRSNACTRLVKFDPWWNSTYAHKTALNVTVTDTSKHKLVSLTDEIDMSRTDDTGFDVVFVNAAETEILPFYRENFQKTGTSYFFLNKSGLSNGVNQIYIYYGNNTPVDDESEEFDLYNMDGEAPLAYFSFATNGDLSDSTGNLSDAVNNGASWTASGYNNGAYDFENSETDYLNITGTTFESVRTISYHVKAESQTNDLYMFSFNSPNKNTFFKFNTETNDDLRYTIAYTTPQYDRTFEYNYALDWQFYTLYLGSTGFDVYIDDLLEDSDTTNNPMNASFNALTLGARNWKTTTPTWLLDRGWDGLFDEFGLWPYHLNTTQRDFLQTTAWLQYYDKGGVSWGGNTSFVRAENLTISDDNPVGYTNVTFGLSCQSEDSLTASIELTYPNSSQTNLSLALSSGTNYTTTFNVTTFGEYTYSGWCVSSDETYYNQTASSEFSPQTTVTASDLRISDSAPEKDQQVTLSLVCESPLPIVSAKVQVTDPDDTATNQTLTFSSGTNYTKSYTILKVGNYSLTGFCTGDGAVTNTTAALNFTSTAAAAGGGGSSGGGGGSTVITNTATCGITVDQPLKKLYTSYCVPGRAAPDQVFLIRNDVNQDVTFTYTTEGEDCTLSPVEDELSNNEQTHLLLGNCACPTAGETSQFSVTIDQEGVCSENITVKLTGSKYAGALQFVKENLVMVLAIVFSFLALLIGAIAVVIKLSAN